MMWQKIKAFFRYLYAWCVQYPLAIILAIGAILLMAILLGIGGGDRFNLGGVLGGLFQKNKKDSDYPKATMIPRNRVDREGNVIPLESPDSEGWTQKDIEFIQPARNPFRDKSLITITNKEGDKEVIKLPTGVLDVDVEKIIKTQPTVYEVVVVNAPREIDEKVIDYLRD